MDLVVFAHLRWDFVHQRPQHLISRFAREGRVFYVEEPVDGEAGLEIAEPLPGLSVVRPHVPGSLPRVRSERLQRELLDAYWSQAAVSQPVVWSYTPMALPLFDHIEASCLVYDCMDELSLFAGADLLLPERERALVARADLLFTGGRSLYEAKRHLHPAIHCFPSSVDRAHYLTAREPDLDPDDQRAIPHPRLGFFGVIDERFDRELVAGLAQARPDWQLVMIGPVVKIDRSSLPAAPNLHFLGGKSYAELPGYIGGWDIAWMPFARNDATRFISPTKVLEYMAAGRPIVSTSIADVVRPYGERGLVRIADTVTGTISATEAALAEDAAARVADFDRVLADTSWDRTYRAMRALVSEVVSASSGSRQPAAVAAD